MPLISAAISFVKLDPLVSSVLIGASSKSNLDRNLVNIDKNISKEFWDVLKDRGLIHPDCVV